MDCCTHQCAVKPFWAPGAAGSAVADRGRLPGRVAAAEGGDTLTLTLVLGFNTLELLLQSF
jgi:hypothetical protein